MYQYQPKRENKIASVLLLAVAILSVAMVGISVSASSFAGLFQLAAVLLLAAEVALFVRYFGKTYVYRIQCFGTKNDVPDFIVSEVSGKNNIIVCRLSLNDLEGMKTRSERKKVRAGKKYNYCVDIAPKNAVYLEFTDSGVPVTVIVSPDEKMISVFEKYMKLRSEDTEE